MHTSPVLDATSLAAYHHHLQSDHDFKVWVEVLSMEETLVCEADLIDGQVNMKPNMDQGGPDRTGTLTLSDPDGVLSFGAQFARDDTNTLWVNRLIRVQHSVDVPGLGVIKATPIVGVPLSVTRNGAEISLELSDKSILMDHGVRPRTYKKGYNVSAALTSIAHDVCGEHHVVIPVTTATLSKEYTIGMGDDSVTPWAVFRVLAKAEMGWRSYFTCDGWLICEPSSNLHDSVPIEHVLALPNASTSFTDFSNYVKVTADNSENDGYNFAGVTYLPATHELSEQSLARNGVVRTLPLVVDDTSLVSQQAVDDRAVEELKNASGVDFEPTFEVMPFFHLDSWDLVTLPGIGASAFTQASIPLGTGGNMTIGTIKWVSAPVIFERPRAPVAVKKAKEKGGAQVTASGVKLTNTGGLNSTQGWFSW